MGTPQLKYSSYKSPKSVKTQAFQKDKASTELKYEDTF